MATADIVRNMLNDGENIRLERLGRFVELSLLERFETEEKLPSYLRNACILTILCKTSILRDVVDEIGSIINNNCSGFVAYEVVEHNHTGLQHNIPFEFKIQMFFESDHDMALLKLSSGSLDGLLG